MVTTLAQLTKDTIRECYLHSVADPQLKRTHIGLNPGGMTPAPTPTPHQIEQDFSSWYGGMLSAARLLDPNSNLPPVKEMCIFITQNTQPVKDAVAA